MLEKEAWTHQKKEQLTCQKWNSGPVRKRSGHIRKGTVDMLEKVLKNTEYDQAALRVVKKQKKHMNN